MPDVRTHAARSLRAVDVRFADFSEFASSGGWSLDFDKLDRGCSRGSIMQVADGAQVRKLPASLRKFVARLRPFNPKHAHRDLDLKRLLGLVLPERRR